VAKTKKPQRDVKRGKKKTDQWHTPQWVIGKSDIVLGGIDLDPASSEIANVRVGAKRFFTKRDAPLDQPWMGAVFVNPPSGDTGRLLPKAFWNKLLAEIAAGNTTHALFLAYRLEMVRTTQVKCAHSLLEFPTCIFERRLVFVNKLGAPLDGNMSPSCITYVPGSKDKTALFVREFGDSGVIVG
jgi:hypothetical protein